MKPQQINELFNTLERLKSEYADKDFDIIVMQTKQEALDRQRRDWRPPEMTFDKCHIGMVMPAIGADGNIYPCCHNIGYGTLGVIGHISEGSFLEVWNSPNRARLMQKTPKKHCLLCSHGDNRINHFMNFLAQEAEENPGFLDWIEQEYIPGLMMKGSPLTAAKVLINLRDKGITEVSRKYFIEKYRKAYSPRTVDREIRSLRLIGLISDKGKLRLAEKYKNITEEDLERMNRAAEKIVPKGLDRWTLDDLAKDKISQIREAVEQAVVDSRGKGRSRFKFRSLWLITLFTVLVVNSPLFGAVGDIIKSGQQAGWGGIFGLGLWGILICAVTVVGVSAIYREVGLAGSGIVEVERVRLSETLGLETLWQTLKSLFEGGQRTVAAIGQRAQESAKGRWGWVVPQKRPTQDQIRRLMELAEELRGMMPQLRTQEFSYPQNPEIISKMLVWSPEEMAGKVEEIEKLARMVRRDYERGEITEVVVIEEAGEYARGGPIITGKLRGYPEIRVLQAICPEAVWEIERKINLEKALFVTSSLGPAYQYFYRKLIRLLEGKGIPAKQIASQVGKHFVGIGEPNTPIATEAKKSKFFKVFNVPEGRSAPYSVFSYQGLVPLALAGVNIKSFVESGKMAEAMCSRKDLRKNPGVKLTLLLEEMRQAGKQIVLVLPEELKGFGEAW
ncbi:MAG: SPASM domain-containing protein, partial [Dehalococcoidia bacterium]|nr:SPASM domain-containing protein [Dehalococcoidia bacterium]